MQLDIFWQCVAVLGFVLAMLAAAAIIEYRK